MGIVDVRAAMTAEEPVTLLPDLAPPPGFCRQPMEAAIREDRSSELVGALQVTHPDDVRVIAAAALLDLTRPPPAPAFASLAEDARWWFAMETKLDALPVTARALAHTGEPDFFLAIRKRLLMALVATLSAPERAAFHSWVQS